MSIAGAIVRHCEVSTSNNGWVIEVVNQAADVTLWLDPESPTSLLKWGSVLCQAVAETNAAKDDSDEIFPPVQEDVEGEEDVEEEEDDGEEEEDDFLIRE